MDNGKDQYLYKTPLPAWTRWLDGAVILLTAAVLLMLLVESTAELSHSARWWFAAIDTAACGIFLFEFFYKIKMARDWRVYARRYWIDFISSIPFVGFLRIGRVVRLARLLRFIRAGVLITKHTRQITAFARRGSFLYLVGIASTTVIAGAAALLFVEQKSFSDSLWWAITTVTTVGYGDIAPATPWGRLAGAVLMIVGVGLFGSFTAMVAVYFLEDKQEEEYSELLKKIDERLKTVESKLDALIAGSELEKLEK